MSGNSDTEDAFGFSSISSAKERIRQIRPSAPPISAVDIAKIDEVADNAGFVSRESQPVATSAVQVFRRRRQPPEPRCALNMRAPESLYLAFASFCEENRYSFTEGLAEIMKRAGLGITPGSR